MTPSLTRKQNRTRWRTIIAFVLFLCVFLAQQTGIIRTPIILLILYPSPI